jgi:hypothetical protein
MAVESISKKSNKGCENGDAYKVCLASKEGDESELLNAGRITKSPLKGKMPLV